MPRNIETVPIKLPDGETWTVKKRLSRGDRRHIDRRVFEDQIALMSNLGAAGISLEQITSTLGSVLGINVKNADAEAEEHTNGSAPAKTVEEVKEELAEEWTAEKADATIERCTVSWSYDDPVTPETIADTDEDIYDFLVEAVKKLYQPRPAEVTENLESVSATP